MCRPFFDHTFRNSVDVILDFRRLYGGETSTVIKTPSTDAYDDDDYEGCFLEIFALEDFYSQTVLQYNMYSKT